MTSTIQATAPQSTRTRAALLTRILNDGYGAGAWHGPDLAAALADVTPAIAFRRPAIGRHNIAEIAVHHAWCVRNATAQISGQPREAFPFDGEDWFEFDDASAATIDDIRSLVERFQATLARVVVDIGTGSTVSPLGDTEQLDIALGLTCHAVYHAGQIQLVKRLVAG